VLGQLTQLRHLELGVAATSSLDAGWKELSALTHLNLRLADVWPQPGPPPDLVDGIRLPSLQALLMPRAPSHAALPMAHTGLTCLDVQLSCRGDALQQLQKLTQMRELYLRVECDADLADTLSALSRLEVLKLEGMSVDGSWPGWPRHYWVHCLVCAAFGCLGVRGRAWWQPCRLPAHAVS
jgi:hypothetical protein